LAAGLLVVALATGANSKTLQTGIEHEERLPALGSQLLPGNVFEEDNLTRLTGETTWGESEWTKIPAWLAGTWQRSTVNETIDGKHSQHHDVRARIFGFQTDVKGDIWHWNRTPFFVVSKEEGILRYFRMETEDIYVNDDVVNVRMNWTEWDLDPSTKKIIAVNRGDQIETITHYVGDLIEVNSSIQTYDLEGKKASQIAAHWKDYRTKAYSQIDVDGTVQVKPLFRAYLFMKDLMHLWPKD